MEKKGAIIAGIIGLLVIVGIIILGVMQSGPAGAGKYDQFAQCINDSGATFYGAFWCPHCQEQKKLFGTSAKLLPYEECSTPDTKGLLPICKEKEIKGYPTWEFADGSREQGKLTFAKLSEKTGCVVPPQE
jgi:thiol-disulfide isomerase/thioredoxin